MTNDELSVHLIAIGQLRVDAQRGLVYAPKSNTPEKPVGAATAKGYIRVCIQPQTGTRKMLQAIPERIHLFETFPLDSGSHKNFNEGACALELISYVAGEPWSDRPECVCPVLGAFFRVWNDDLPDSERDATLRPFLPRLIGTNGGPKLAKRRAFMAADWLVRVHVPAWLRLAKLNAKADTLEVLPEITSMAIVHSLRGAAEADAARARAAWDVVAKADAARARAAWDVVAKADAARARAAWDVVAKEVAAAGADAAWAASGAWAAAAWTDTTWDAVMVAAAWTDVAAMVSAARAVVAGAVAASGADAAWDVAKAALRPTRDLLIKSASELVERMLAADNA